MKHRMRLNGTTTVVRPTNAAAVVLILAALASPVSAKAADPYYNHVISTDARVAGLTYGEYGARWWQWALGQPPEVNPVLDPTGELAASGQEGPVWFLAGTFGGPAERTIDVPAGKKLFFPISNWTSWEPDDHAFALSIAEHVGVDPNTLTNVELMALLTAWLTDHSPPLSCTVDGLPIADLESYRAAAAYDQLDVDPGMAALFGIDGGSKGPGVADGYWIMLQPLTPGEHTIEFHAEAVFSVANGDPFDLYIPVDVLYHVKIDGEED